MTRVVLHVGAHKTGSTSIQKTLGHFRSRLEREGVALYAGTNHTDFYRAFTDVPESYHQFYRGWRQNLRQAATREKIRRHFKTSDSSTHLISAEDMSLLSEAALLDMKRFLQEECACDDISVVCYLREPIEYLNSSLQQFIKPGITSLDDFLANGFMNYRLQGCPEFGGGMGNILSQLYFPIPGRLLRVFGRDSVSFIKFEQAVTAGLARSLLAQVLPGKPLPWLQEFRHNESLSHEACILLAEYNNRHPLLFENHRLNKKRNREKRVVPVLRSVPGRKAELVAEKNLDLDAINAVIRQVNVEAGREIFKPVAPLPAKYSGDGLLHFSRESLAFVAQYIGHEEMPVTVADAVLTVQEVSALTRLIEARAGMSLVARFVQRVRKFVT